jgi:hypothetical protein
MLPMPGGAGRGRIDTRNIREPVLETSLLWLGEKRIARYPFVRGPDTPRIKHQGVRVVRIVCPERAAAAPPTGEAENSPGVEQGAKSIAYEERNVVNPKRSRKAVGR